MPRIPVYQGGQAALPATIPYGRIGGVGPSGVMAAAQGLSGVSESLTQAAVLEKQAAAAQARADEVLKREEVNLDITRLTSRFEIDYANYETELSETGIPPERIAEHMRSFAQQHIQTLGGELRYPESMTKYLTAIEPVVKKSIIGTDSIAVKRRHAMIEGDASAQNDADALAAVVGPPEQRAARLQSIYDRITHLTNVGIYGGKERRAELERTAREIQKGEVVRDFDNPALARSVLDRLNAGGYGHIGGLAEQRAFGYGLMERAYTLQEREKKEVKEQWEALQKQAYGDMLDRAHDGTLTREEYHAGVKQWRLEPSQRDHLRVLMAKEPNVREPASDPRILDLVTATTHQRTPTMTHEQLNQYRAAFLAGQPGLNFKDWKEALDKLAQGEQKRIEDSRYGRSVAGQYQSEAEQQIQMALGLPPGPIPAGVESRALRVLADARLQLANRSAYFKGREDPMVVARELIARPGYVNIIGNNAVRSANELLFSLPQGQTPEKLEQQYRNDKQNPEYRRQRAVYDQLDALRREEEAARAAAQATSDKAIPAPTIWERIFGRGGAAPLTPAPAETPAPVRPKGRSQRGGQRREGTE